MDSSKIKSNQDEDRNVGPGLPGDSQEVGSGNSAVHLELGLPEEGHTGQVREDFFFLQGKTK